MSQLHELCMLGYYFWNMIIFSYRGHGIVFQNVISTISWVTVFIFLYDTCHEKIDLFKVQNRVVHELSQWKYSSAYNQENVFSVQLSNFWIFWYQIYHNSTNRTDLSKIPKRPKNRQYFEPQTGLFSILMTRVILSWPFFPIIKY